MPLVLGKARPRDRSEEEIQAYRKALELIHARGSNWPISAEALKALHRTCQDGAGDAGEWKRRANDIIELRDGQPPRVRFRPTPPAEVPGAIAELCLAYDHANEQSLVPPLVATGLFVFDFLCVHPFRVGNGRVSRLLTLLALYQHGYEVGRYISLERLIEDSREEYYAALAASSIDWHSGRHELVPWLNYWLTIVRRGYRLFEERAGQVSTARGGKRPLIEAAVEAQPSPFALADIERACPGVSRDMIRKVLRELRDAGRIEPTRAGRGAKWQKRY